MTTTTADIGAIKATRMDGNDDHFSRDRRPVAEYLEVVGVRA